MTKKHPAGFGAVFTLLLAATSIVSRAQATSATATQQLALSAFGGVNGTYTNLLGGRNLGITAGGDLAFMSFHRYRPVLELRGTVPIHNGQIDAQKDFLGGLKVERQFGQVHPYIDFLVGRGQIDYQRGGLQIGSVVFLSSTSTVFSPGAGLDYDLTHHWSVKADFQYQHWDVPFATIDGRPAPITIVTTPEGSFQVATKGTLYSKALTLGAVYRFDFNQSRRRPRHDR